MDSNLYGCLYGAGVREDSLRKLEDDELNTVDMLDCTSDELLKACGLKGGQIILLRKGIETFKENAKTKATPSSRPSSPVCKVRSTPLRCSTPSSGSSTPTMECSYFSSRSSSPAMESSLPATRESIPLPSKLATCTPNTAFQSFTKHNGGDWINAFSLPSIFSPSVTSELEAQRLSGNSRNEFTRDVCSAVRMHTMFPTKTEREHVSFMITKKYPFLADKLGTGIGSWQQAIKNRFKNLRKTKRPMLKLGAENRTPKQAKKATSTNHVHEMADGETAQICEERIVTMKREMAKTTNRNYVMVKELMELTYPYRRQGILSEPTVIKKLLEFYPALQLISELKAEFGRVVDDKNVTRTIARKFKSLWQPKILAFAASCTKSEVICLLSEMAEELTEELEKKSVIEETVAVLLLPLLLKESVGSKNGEVIKICSVDESLDQVITETTAPRLVGSGDIATISPLYIVAEGMVVAKLDTFYMGLATCLALLVGTYYIFNFQYPRHAKNVFLFLEAVLMDNPCEAKKRVAINKFLQDLASY